jgi:hypothetical protein
VADRTQSFDTLVLGPANLLAATAARRVAEFPGGVYNPLVIRGDHGVGKTHLLNALANAASELNSDLAIRLESGVELAERFTVGLTAGDVRPVRDVLVNLDLLLVDDLDSLAEFGATQRELVGIIRSLLDRRKQVVVSSVLPPMRLAGLQPDLQTLLGRGLLVDIDAPDGSARRAIVMEMARRHSLELKSGIIDALVRLGPSDLSRLEASITRLSTLASELGRPLLPDDVHRVLEARSAPAESREFGAFVDDVSRALAAVVEEAPWRRRVAAAILHWEAAGLRTSRLDDALQADTPPDVESLLETFTRDARRLLEIRRQLGSRADDEQLYDPSDLQRAEAILQTSETELDRKSEAGSESQEKVSVADAVAIVDPAFLDPRNVVLSFVDIEDRLVEGQS